MNYPVFDLHADTADRIAWQSLPATLKEATGLPFYGPGDEQEPAKCRALDHSHCHISLDSVGNVPWAQCFACYIPDELTPRQARELFDDVSSYLLHEIERLSGQVRTAHTVKDVQKGLDAGVLMAVRTIENARLFALDPALVEECSRKGVWMASLSWNAAGPLASGHDTLEGLSAAGRATVLRMEREGMALDVSHLNDQSLADVMATTNAPLVASHSNSRSVCGHPRNLTDDQFREIAGRGGLVGLNFCEDFLTDSGHASFDDISFHLDRWLELGGEDVIALGSDFDGCDTPACISTAAEMPSFQDLLRERFGEGITRKLCADNALSFFKRQGR
ncbi:MAG: membrane dipeptidase [Coriobacteriaceae bacterium]|nr:membrane dipeptidase [Coriobacteriaceae bacterium]